MATYYTPSSRGYTLRVDVNEGFSVQDPPSRTVNYSIYLVTTNNAVKLAVEHGYLNLNGERVWTAPGSYDFTNRFHQTIHLKTGSLSVAYNADGTKTMAIAASFSAPSGGLGPTTIAISTSQVLTPINVWTPVKAPSTVSVSGASNGKREIIPGTHVTISWSGHASGLNNAIQSYTLQYNQSGSGWQNWKTGLTTASYTGAMPDNTRGASFYFRVVVYGTQDSATSGQSGDYVRNNELPSAAMATLDKSGTVVSTVTSVVATVSDPAYYSRSLQGPKTAVKSGDTLALNPGSNTFYFWGWDGLEYSASSTNRTVVRNVKPTLTLKSVAISGTAPILDGYSSSSYPFAHDVRTTVAPSKTSGKLKFYARKAETTTLLGSATSIYLRNQTVTSTSDHGLTINLLSYLTNPIFGQYVRIGVVFNDGVEDSSTYWQTYGFYLGNAPAYVGFYNNAAGDSNVIDSQSSHFYRELRIQHKINSKVSKYRIAYGTTNSEVAGTVPGIYDTGSNYTSVKLIPVNTFTPGTTYHFWLEASYSNGSTARIGPWSKTQVPSFPFDNPTISSTVVAPIKNPNSTTHISFTKKTLASFSVKNAIGDSSVFKLEFRRSDKSRVIAATATVDEDSFDFSATHQMAYPFDLNTAATSGSHNPFNLNFNEVHVSAYFRVTVTNAFGVAYSNDFGPVALDLKNVLAFHAGGASSSYSKDGTTWAPTLASPAPILFEREKLRFSYPRAVSHVGTPLRYEIIEVSSLGEVVLASAVVNATGTDPSPAEDLHAQTLPRINATETVTYKVRVRDPKGQQAVKDFTGSVTKAQHIPVIATLDQYVPAEEGGHASVDLTISDLGGGVDGVHLKKVDIDLETSTLSDFSSIKETIVLKANLVQSGTDPTIPDLDGIHTSWTPASDADLDAEALLFFRLKFTTYPDTTGGLAQSLISYSPYVAIYNKAPTLSWRENWVGVNTKNEGMYEVFAISQTSTKNLIVLKGATGTITIDLNTGTIDGITIDGGSW